jgi:hypothetical protein
MEGDLWVAPTAPIVIGGGSKGEARLAPTGHNYKWDWGQAMYQTDRAGRVDTARWPCPYTSTTLSCTPANTLRPTRGDFDFRQKNRRQ